MLYVIDSAGNGYGPFSSVTEEGGVLHCYGGSPLDLPLAVVGTYTTADAFERAAAPVVPDAVTMRQARLALLAAGKLAAVQDAINALPSPQKEAAQIEWEYSNEVRRHQPFVQALAPALGLNDAALDALFIAAQGM